MKQILTIAPNETASETFTRAIKAMFPDLVPDLAELTVTIDGVTLKESYTNYIGKPRRLLGIHMSAGLYSDSKHRSVGVKGVAFTPPRPHTLDIGALKSKFDVLAVYAREQADLKAIADAKYQAKVDLEKACIQAIGDAVPDWTHLINRSYGSSVAMTVVIKKPEQAVAIACLVATWDGKGHDAS